MAYATIDDLQKRCKRTISDSEIEMCSTLLDDASVIVDAYGKNASIEAKSIVCCNMVIRAIGDGTVEGVPIGATQGTMSANGYSQTWTMGSGATTGEMYLSKMDKKLLGAGNKVGFSNPFERRDSDERDYDYSL